MIPFNHINKSVALPASNIITAWSLDRLLNSSRQEKDQQVTTNLSSITSLLLNTTFPSTSQYQQIKFDEPYSVKTGIKTGVLLGGMLALVIIYLCWKARSRLCRCPRFSSSDIANAHRSSNKFDLDYWLQQVDIHEAKEAERNRENLSPYLELPAERPRNNELATATWIVDAWRQRRLVQYQEQHRLLQSRPNEPAESNPPVYRRRRHMIQRFLRRFLVPSPPQPSFLVDYTPSLIADMRPSIVNHSLIPLPATCDVQPRRVASWPRLKSADRQTDTMMSGLRTQNTRKRLLKRPSKMTTFDI